jgi:hypothetical protein
MIDRRNQTVVKSVPFPDAQNPHMIPPPETVIWHYVRFDYFQNLVEEPGFVVHPARQTVRQNGRHLTIVRDEKHRAGAAFCGNHSDVFKYFNSAAALPYSSKLLSSVARHLLK